MSDAVENTNVEEIKKGDLVPEILEEKAPKTSTTALDDDVEKADGEAGEEEEGMEDFEEEDLQMALNYLEEEEAGDVEEVEEEGDDVEIVGDDEGEDEPAAKRAKFAEAEDETPEAEE